MKEYLCEKEEVLKNYDSSEKGLTQAQADERLQKNGKNKLAEAKKVSLLRRFIDQLTDPMTLVLLAAAVVSAITSAVSHESFADVFITLRGGIRHVLARYSPCCHTHMYGTDTAPRAAQGRVFSLYTYGRFIFFE